MNKRRSWESKNKSICCLRGSGFHCTRAYANTDARHSNGEASVPNQALSYYSQILFFFSSSILDSLPDLIWRKNLLETAKFTGDFVNSGISHKGLFCSSRNSKELNDQLPLCPGCLLEERHRILSKKWNALWNKLYYRHTNALLWWNMSKQACWQTSYY